MKEKTDWKFNIACVLGIAMITGSYLLYDIAPDSAICFTIVGIMIPTGYVYFRW